MVIWELLNVISGESSGISEYIPVFCIMTVVLFIIVFCTRWLQYNKTYTVAYEESANRRIVLAEKLRRLPLSFFGQKNLSDLTTTIMGDCTALERVFSNALPQLFGTIFMFIITAIGLLVMDWRLGLCIVIPVPVAALVVFAARKAQAKAESANMDAKRAAYDGVQEYLDTIQELKSCSREEEYLAGLEKKLDYVVKCSFRNEIAPGAATTTAQFILRFGLVAVLLVGGYLVAAGSLTIPMFILYLIFAGRIYDPFTSCFMLMAEVFSSLVSVKRMKQIDATPEQTGSNVCNNKGFDIEFKNVHFSYNEEPVLKGVSFTAKQGEVTALVGPSGSGKSTASKLAARFWDADSGQITLGGVDVKSVEPETLFKNFAIVFQDVLLFDETVMENIRLGRSGATDEEVKAAARAGFEALDKYTALVRAEGEKAIKYARDNEKPIMILAGRPYHCDAEISHGIDKLALSLGFVVVSEDSVAHLAKTPEVHVLNQWTYHSRLYRAASFAAENPDVQLVQLVSFGCGVDAITTDEVRRILELKGKYYTQIKIDEIANLGAVKIRLRSLKAVI